MRWKNLGALLLAVTLVYEAAGAEPRIAGPISYIKPSSGRHLQATAKEGSKKAAAAAQPELSGSWWVPDATEQKPAAAEGSVAKQKGAKAESGSGKGKAAKGSGDKTGSVKTVDGKRVKDATVAQSALAGVHTLQDGTGDRTTALGNLYVAAKISPQAVSPKSFQGTTRPSMPDSTQINPSDYPDAELEGTPAAAWAQAPAAAAPESAEASAAASLQSSSNSSAGQLAVNPKITPRLPPPPPPMQQNSTPPVASTCSGYVTKEEIVAGLEYAAGQEYLPFDPCWDVRLAALKGYYGQPKSTIFPFAYLNPGGYISNVTFWLNALKDYELGKAPYIMIPSSPSSQNTTNGTTSSDISVPIGADGISTVTPPATPPADAPVSTGYGINWYGGPVLNNKAGFVVYYIWYGAWGNLNNKGTADRPTTVKVLTDMAQSVGGTPWFGTATTYTDQNGAVVNKIAYGGRAGITAASKCWQGKSLSNDQIFNAVDCAIQNKQVPYATNGVYILLGASNVKANSGMCVNYCGWHTYGFDSQNRQTLFGFIGSPLPCLSACTAQGASNVLATPNYNAEADGMASIVAHELMETATDPLINAWYTASGYENADLCAWTFSSSTFAAGGGLANVRWNCPAAAAKAGCTSRYYLIQQNWVNISPGICGLSVP